MDFRDHLAALSAQNFGRWHEPMNGTLSLYECGDCGGDTPRWWGHSNPANSYEIRLNFVHSQAMEMLKHDSCPSLSIALKSHHFVKLSSSIFLKNILLTWDLSSMEYTSTRYKQECISVGCVSTVAVAANRCQYPGGLPTRECGQPTGRVSAYWRGGGQPTVGCLPTERPLENRQTGVKTLRSPAVSNYCTDFCSEIFYLRIYFKIRKVHGNGRKYVRKTLIWCESYFKGLFPAYSRKAE